MQRASVFGFPLRICFHFDADIVLAAAPHEIHFGSRGRAVVGQRATAIGIRQMRTQFVEYIASILTVILLAVYQRDACPDAGLVRRPGNRAWVL